MYKTIYSPKNQLNLQKMNLTSSTNKSKGLSQSQQLSLASQIKRIEPFMKKLKEQSKKSIITTFFGSTGVGKSSLISCLLGAELNFNKGKGGRYEINHNNNHGQYPEIGHKRESCTTIPKIYSDKYANYVDLPGFFDTKSQSQQIINSICCSKLFSKNHNIKIVIVIEASQLTIQRGGKLVQIFNRICSIFKKNLRQIINSVVLVVSKASVQQYQLSDIAQQINSIIQLNKNLTYQSKELLNRIINRSRIVLFPLPQEIIYDHIKSIRQKIELLSQATLNYDSDIALSYSALNIVNQCKIDLNQKLQEIGKKITSQIEIFVKFYSLFESESLNNLKDNINLLQQYTNQLNSNLLKGESYQLRRFFKFLNEQMQVQKQTCDQLQKNIIMIDFYNQIVKSNSINRFQLQIQYDFIAHMKMKAIALTQQFKTKRKKLQLEKQRKQLKRKYKRERRYNYNYNYQSEQSEQQEQEQNSNILVTSPLMQILLLNHLLGRLFN